MDEAKRRFPSPKTCVNIQTNPFLIRLCVRTGFVWMGKGWQWSSLMQKNMGGTEVKPWLPLPHIWLSHTAGTCASDAGRSREAGPHAASRDAHAPGYTPRAPAGVPHCCPRAQRGLWEGDSSRLKAVTLRSTQGRAAREQRAAQQGRSDGSANLLQRQGSNMGRGAGPYRGL